MTNPLNKPRLLALAIASAVLAPAHANSIDSVNEDNLSLVTVDGVDTAQIYQDLTETTSNGFLLADPDEGSVYPGIAVYVQGTDKCIMAAKADTSAGTCKLPPDSGKRFKLRGQVADEPMDIVLDVSDSAAEETYRVLGKLTNLTGASLKGFRVDVGFGLGENFVGSVAGDGVELVPDDEHTSEDGTVIGKYPGGLFGGSPAEGLPFFTVDSAQFIDQASDEDVYASWTMPSQYAGFFGDWLTSAAVPTAWFYDFDGQPWTDDKLLAWQEADLSWSSMSRSFDVAIEAETIFGVYVYDAASLATEVSQPDFSIEQLVEDINTANAAEIGWVDISLKDLLNVLLKHLVLTKETSVDTSGWVNNPPTAVYGVSEFADWDAATGVYTVTAAISFTAPAGIVSETCTAGNACDYVLDQELPMEEVQSLVENDPANFSVDTGYVQGPIEDLANVNMTYNIKLAANAGEDSWCTALDCSITLRITPITREQVIEPDPVVDNSVPLRSTSNGGCAVGNSTVLDPLLPGMALLSLAWLLLRRRQIASH
ncbi:MAG TPA: choice-of-anchor F family protein [Pseudomonadales bacterium]